MYLTRRKFLALATLATSTAVRGTRALAAEISKLPHKPMRILILGGTGFIGPYQVRYAIARGHQVTLFNRGKEPLNKCGPARSRNCLATGTPEISRRLKAASGMCVSTDPTTLPFWVRDAGRVLHGKVKQYIFISTISVYAGDDKPGDELAFLVSYTGKNAMAETLESLRANVGELYRAAQSGQRARSSEAVSGNDHRHPARPDRRSGRPQ